MRALIGFLPIWLLLTMFAFATERLVYLDGARIEIVRKAGAGEGSPFRRSIRTVLSDEGAVLVKPIDPVINKTAPPPSGSKNDYFSVRPYWWPNPDTAYGLPWVRRDGETNPMTRGPHTDRLRLAAMFDDLETLNLAFLISQDRRYAARLGEIVTAWFIDTRTRVNPNVSFGQAVPGRSKGRAEGIIEWGGVSNLVSTAQLLKQGERWPSASQAALDQWLRDYLIWLRTSAIGQDAENRKNNHGSWYDHTTIGLMIYLGDEAGARTKAQTAKAKRIAEQIAPNGVQIHETERTKSISCSAMNLWALTNVARLARQVDVDLFAFETQNGVGLQDAFAFLAPFANGAQDWKNEQISEGGGRCGHLQRSQPNDC
jgi:hypothetical protein